MNWQDELKASLYMKGFNLFGLCSIESYNQSVTEKNMIPPVFSSCKNIIIFGSGGKYFWELFKKFLESPEGGFLRNMDDPIDTYTELILEHLKIEYPELIREHIYPFKKSDLIIDFQKLAVCAGLGHFSPYIKLVLHPSYGPWVSLRGAFLTGAELESTGPLLTSVPCTSCLKPCLQACPVKAVTEKNFDFTICSNYRDLEKDCLSHCHVRTACILGPEHAYSYEEGLHRNKSSLKTIRNYYNFIKKP